MNTKYALTAIAIVVVAIIALMVFSQNQNDNDLAGQNDTTNSATNTDDQQDSDTAAEPANTNSGSTNTQQSQPSGSEPTVPDGNDIAVFEITYDGKAYTPSQLTIKNGDVVVFKNASTGSFWPASAPHPQHTNYPELDPKASIGAGQNWQFKFTKTGTWGFHDHLNPTAFGRITVQ